MTPQRRPFEPELIDSLSQDADEFLTLSLALREEDNGKRAGSVTVPDNSSASEAQKKGCHLFRRHSHRTRSCRSQRSNADHVE